MNRYKILIGIMISTLFTGVTFSQRTSTFTTETQGGYEYNYFKSPDVIRTEGIILNSDDLISSSFYQDIKMKYKYKTTWGKNKFRVSASPFSRVFYENLDDSYWSLSVIASYDYKISKRIGLYTKAEFKRMNREGLGGDQDVLINPLGYTNYGGSLGIGLKPFRNHQMKVGGFYNFKNFDAFGIRDLQYDEYGVQLSSVQSFKVKRLKHKIGINGYFKKRLYDTFNASDIEPDGERDWDYIKGTLFYQLPFSKTFSLKPNFMYYVRIDNSTNRSGFNQYGPGITMKYNTKKTDIKGSFSFITRNYTDIQARNTDELIGDKLAYEYSNVQVDARQNIGNGFSLMATLFSKIRSTNYTDIDARSFRNYRNQYAGVGVLWQF